MSSVEEPVGSPAPVPWRLVAAAVDLALTLVPALVVGLAVPGGGGVVVALGVGVAITGVQLMLQARQGWTLGQRLMFLRLVDQSTGMPIETVRAVQRVLVVAAGALVVGVGAVVVLLSPLWDKSGRRRGWHDVAVGAEVLYVRDVQRQAVTPTSGTKVAPAAPVVGVSTSTDETPVLAFGLMPELERTRKAPSRTDVAWDDAETYRPMTAELELSDGSVHEVQGVVLIGRNPIAGPGQTGLRLADGERSLSRTHLRLTVGPIAVWAEDLGSVNGSFVRLPDGTKESCEPGRPLQVPVGSTVGIGDAWARLRKIVDEAAFPESTKKR